MLGRPFFARVKVYHTRVYCCILAQVCAVAMATGLLKKKDLKKWFLVYLTKIQSLDFVLNLLTVNSHKIPSANTVLIKF